MIEDLNKIVRCGKCFKYINPTSLLNPTAISDWDHRNGYKRYLAFNCCERTWLINNDEEPID